MRPQSRSREYRSAPYHQPIQITFGSDVDDGGKWTHDLFDANAGPASSSSSAVVGVSYGGAQRRAAAEPVVPKGETKVLVSNLAPTVTEDDLKDLFSECGRLKAYNMHYNKNGQPVGTADVIFEEGSGAVQAIQTYNNIALDGAVLRIELVASQNRSIQDRLTGVRAPAASSSFLEADVIPLESGFYTDRSQVRAPPTSRSPFRGGSRPSRGGGRSDNYNNNNNNNGGGGRNYSNNNNNNNSNNNSSNNRRGGGRGGSRGGAARTPREKKPALTAAELDAQLDAYVAQASAASSTSS